MGEAVAVWARICFFGVLLGFTVWYAYHISNKDTDDEIDETQRALQALQAMSEATANRKNISLRERNGAVREAKRRLPDYVDDAIEDRRLNKEIDKAVKNLKKWTQV